MTQLPPPGWYPDADSRYQRWWDGQRWTDSLQAVPPSAPVFLPQSNGLATTSLVGGIASSAVAALAIITAIGIDPLLALFMLAGTVVSLAAGIPALVRANRMQPHVGRARSVWGIVLGAGAIVLVAVIGTVELIAAIGGADATSA